ncbi:MAG: biotin transporter BioY [Lachnospiraceae bacterium]
MRSTKIFTLTLTALFTAIICILGPLTIPVGPIPLTLCNLSILLAAYVLGPWWGTASVAIYILLGVVGLPVFSAGGAGVAKVIGPTGGYIFGYLFLSLFTGLFVKKFKGNLIFSIVGMLIGLIVLYFFGTIWYIVVTNVDVKAAIGACVLPFLPGDAIKIVIALFVGSQLQRRLPLLTKQITS